MTGADRYGFDGEGGGARARVRRLAAHAGAWGGALLLAWLVQATTFQTYRVASDSMAPALRTGDHVLVNKLVFGARLPLVGVRLPALRDPRPGDVVLFRHPDAPGEIHVKRCAATAGGEAALPTGTVPVPADMLFVLGDNTGASSDSRAWGFLPRDLVVGGAACIVWSAGRDGVRWERILRGVGDEAPAGDGEAAMAAGNAGPAGRTP